MNKPAPQLKCGCIPLEKMCPVAQELWNKVENLKNVLATPAYINLRKAENEFADHCIENGYVPERLDAGGGIKFSD